MSYIYIITNLYNTVLYIGVTNDLKRRVYEHKHKMQKGFSAEYNLSKLVYYEQFFDITQAIDREKQLKKWNRAWKNHLIDKFNPSWRDLYDEICG